MIVAYSYFQEIDSPANKAFVERFQAKYGADAPYINELAARTYEGVYLWAEGVKKAGTLDRMAVIEALESPVSIEGPSGKVEIEPKTHHALQNVYLAELKDQKYNIIETYEQQPPADTLLVCDLQKDPNQAKFYFENGLEAAGIK